MNYIIYIHVYIHETIEWFRYRNAMYPSFIHIPREREQQQNCIDGDDRLLLVLHTHTNSPDTQTYIYINWTVMDSMCIIWFIETTGWNGHNTCNKMYWA